MSKQVTLNDLDKNTVYSYDVAGISKMFIVYYEYLKELVYLDNVFGELEIRSSDNELYKVEVGVKKEFPRRFRDKEDVATSVLALNINDDAYLSLVVSNFDGTPQLTISVLSSLQAVIK